MTLKCLSSAVTLPCLLVTREQLLSVLVPRVKRNSLRPNYSAENRAGPKASRFLRRSYISAASWGGFWSSTMLSYAFVALYSLRTGAGDTHCYYVLEENGLGSCRAGRQGGEPCRSGVQRLGEEGPWAWRRDEAGWRREKQMDARGTTGNKQPRVYSRNE